MLKLFNRQSHWKISTNVKIWNYITVNKVINKNDVENAIYYIKQ